MEKTELESILHELTSTGADFAEIFLENSTTKKYSYLNNNLDDIEVKILDGVGLRIALDKDIYYGYTNQLSNEGVNKVINNLIVNIEGDKKYDNIKLNEKAVYNSNPKINHDEYGEENKKDFLKKFNEKIREKNEFIEQVSLTIYENDQKVTIANHTGLYVEDNRMLTRVIVSVVAKKGESIANVFKPYGSSSGYELLDTIDIEKESDIISEAINNKLDAVPCIGCEMPVIMAPGFGAVIFHEACGHAMEATSVADDLSVLSGKLGQKIASDKVTIIDDGSIDKYWGSTHIDDEGNKTRKNLLIENGVLKGYLIDELNNRKMNMNVTGSGRRESYHYAPTSRMNNTYLSPGTDKVEDMIKNTKFGLFAKRMGGGSVSPTTGEFNFAVTEGYMIRDGKIAECVKSASLIGTTLDILNNVESVSDNLEYETGACGSVSGWVPVTIGQPTIKVSKILVGGVKNDK